MPLALAMVMVDEWMSGCVVLLALGEACCFDSPERAMHLLA